MRPLENPGPRVHTTARVAPEEKSVCVKFSDTGCRWRDQPTNDSYAAVKCSGKGTSWCPSAISASRRMRTMATAAALSPCTQIL